MFEKTLSNDTKSNLESIGRTSLASQFYLAGGTAIALQLGHRQSFDLDFFTPDHFSIDSVLETLKSLGQVDLIQADQDTFNGQLNGSRLSFFRYPYPLLDSFLNYANTQIASPVDLASMKVDAITRRGTKRDFIDLYFICQQLFPLEQAMENYFSKFRDFNISRVHVVKSLTYFEDAESDDMPQMLKPVKWADVKKFFQDESKTLTQKRLK